MRLGHVSFASSKTASIFSSYTRMKRTRAKHTKVKPCRTDAKYTFAHIPEYFSSMKWRQRSPPCANFLEASARATYRLGSSVLLNKTTEFLLFGTMCFLQCRSEMLTFVFICNGHVQQHLKQNCDWQNQQVGDQQHELAAIGLGCVAHDMSSHRAHKPRKFKRSREILACSTVQTPTTMLTVGCHSHVPP